MYIPLIFRCPDVCRCEGLTVDCSISTWTNDTSKVPLSPSTRMLDVSKRPRMFSSFNLDQTKFYYLLHLNISHCQIQNLSANILSSMRNLLVLDLSNNMIHTIHSSVFIYQLRLKSLRIDANEGIMTIESKAFVGLNSLNN